MRQAGPKPGNVGIVPMDAEGEEHPMTNEYIKEAWMVPFKDGRYMAFTNANAAWRCYRYWNGVEGDQPTGYPFPAITPEDDCADRLRFDFQNPRFTNRYVKMFCWRDKVFAAWTHFRERDTSIDGPEGAGDQHDRA